jgi:hypothetical protein
VKKQAKDRRQDKKALLWASFARASFLYLLVCPFGTKQVSISSSHLEGEIEAMLGEIKTTRKQSQPKVLLLSWLRFYLAFLLCYARDRKGEIKAITFKHLWCLSWLFICTCFFAP